MSPFEHLSVLFSIIIGLGVARLLSRVAALVQAHERVRSYWLAVLWAALVFTMQVEWWRASFGFRQQTEWSFFYFLFVLLSPVTLFLAATLVLPEMEAGASYDLRDHYFRTRPWLFSLVAAGTALDAVRRALQSGPDDFGAASNAVSAVIVASLVFSKSALYHAVVSVLLASVFLHICRQLGHPARLSSQAPSPAGAGLECLRSVSSHSWIRSRYSGA